MKYVQVFDGDRIAPIMKGYRMACCDCGLVHTIDFEVVRMVDQRGGGFTGKPVKSDSYRVILTAFRNNRATAAKRRQRKKR